MSKSQALIEQVRSSVAVELERDVYKRQAKREYQQSRATSVMAPSKIMSAAHSAVME